MLLMLSQGVLPSQMFCHVAVNLYLCREERHLDEDESLPLSINLN
jgi:hypothetical protein